MCDDCGEKCNREDNIRGQTKGLDTLYRNWWTLWTLEEQTLWSMEEKTLWTLEEQTLRTLEEQMLWTLEEQTL